MAQPLVLLHQKTHPSRTIYYYEARRSAIIQKSGFRGFVPKTELFQELPIAIKEITKGKVYFNIKRLKMSKK